MIKNEYHVLFMPTRPDPILAVRIDGLTQAINMAGGDAVVLPNQFSINYPRDLFIIAGNWAFYPSINGHTDKAFWPFIKQTHNLTDLGVMPGPDFEGGNAVMDEKRNTMLVGFAPLLGTPRIDLYRAAGKISGTTGYDVYCIEQTTPHLDCAVGLLPNGEFLVKLAEPDFSEDDSYINNGITKTGLHQLTAYVGRETLRCFSFGDHPDADFVLGTDVLEHRHTAKPLSMLTNFITVGSTIVGEDFPENIKRHVIENGMSIVSCVDVGMESFLPRYEDFVGGAHCLTLQFNERPDFSSLRPTYYPAQG